MKKLLQDYKAGKVNLSTVLQKLKTLPYEDLEFAKIDTHREIRKGYPETIFCQGKTLPQISQILKKLPKDQNILLTKANKNVYASIKKIYAEASYNESAKTVVIQRYKPKQKKGKILVLTAGTSDIPVAEEAVVTAQLMGNRVEAVYDVGVAGVHRAACGQWLQRTALTICRSTPGRFAHALSARAVSMSSPIVIRNELFVFSP